MNFEEAYKGRSEEVKKYGRMFFDVLRGQEIVDLEYGPDADGDSQLYYLVLKSGIKIGMARVFPNGDVAELDRTEKYSDDSIIRFQFHFWPMHCPECFSTRIEDWNENYRYWNCTKCKNTWKKEDDAK